MFRAGSGILGNYARVLISYFTLILSLHSIKTTFWCQDSCPNAPRTKAVIKERHRGLMWKRPQRFLLTPVLRNIRISLYYELLIKTKNDKYCMALMEISLKIFDFFGSPKRPKRFPTPMAVASYEVTEVRTSLKFSDRGRKNTSKQLCKTSSIFYFQTTYMMFSCIGQIRCF